METFLSQLLSFPPHPESAKPLPDSEYDKQIKNLVQHLNTIPASKLNSGVPGGGDLLDVCQEWPRLRAFWEHRLMRYPTQIIDPAKHTLPYLYTLLAHIHGSGKQKSGSISESFQPGSELWQKMLDFMEAFDERQIRYAGTELRRLIEVTATRAQRVSQVSLSPVKIV